MKFVKIKRNKYAESRFFYNNPYLLILVSKLPENARLREGQGAS